MDQYTDFASGIQPMKSPPMRVRRWIGKAALEVSDTLMLGVGPPTNGNVTKYTLLPACAST